MRVFLFKPILSGSFSLHCLNRWAVWWDSLSHTHETQCKAKAGLISLVEMKQATFRLRPFIRYIYNRGNRCAGPWGPYPSHRRGQHEGAGSPHHDSWIPHCRRAHPKWQLRRSIFRISAAGEACQGLHTSSEPWEAMLSCVVTASQGRQGGERAMASEQLPKGLPCACVLGEAGDILRWLGWSVLQAFACTV